MRSGKIFGCALGMAIMAVAGWQIVQADDDLPKRPNFDRYKGMLDHSPFTVATAVAAPVGAPNFARDLYVANAAKSPDGDMVTIASSSDKEFKKYLTTKEAVDGYGIASIEWSERVGETKVTISKDGQFATLSFNQALIASPVPGRPPISQQPPQRPMPLPPGGAPNPHTRGLIQRNPALNQSPTPFQIPPPSAAEE